MDAIVVGIDVSKDRLDVHVLPSGEAFFEANDAAGAEQLGGRLLELSPALVALEATGGFETLAAALFGAAGLPVAVVNPAQVRSFAVALGSDAARQSADVKASFETGIREYLEMLDTWVGETDGKEPSGKAMAMLSTMVGAVLLSRAVNDERLSKRFLQAAAENALTGSSARNAQQGPRQ